MKRVKFNFEDLNQLLSQGIVSKALNYETGLYEDFYSVKDNEIIVEDLEFDTPNDKEFDFKFNSNLYTVNIVNCVFKRKVNIIGANAISVHFNNTIFEKGLKIVSNLKSLKITNCITEFSFYFQGDISEAFLISYSNFKELIIDECNIYSNFAIEKVRVSEISKISKVFLKETSFIDFTCSTLILAISNKDSIFHTKSILIIAKSNISKLVLNHKFYAELSIILSEITEFEFTNQLLSKKINIINSTIRKNFNLDFDIIDPECTIVLESCIFEGIVSVRGNLGVDSSLEMNNCLLRRLFITQFKNFGNLRLVLLKQVEMLGISNSNLGKAIIHNCKFSDSKFEFDKSQISDLFISETDFPKTVTLRGKPDYGQAKLAFSQLQTVFQKQGDSVRSYEYLAREINSYYHQLHFLSQDFFAKVNLFFNLISNDFGRNWIRGFGFSFGVGILFFYSLIISTDQYVIGFPVTAGGLTGPFLKFMNPLRHFDPEALFNSLTRPITLSGWSYVWDFLGRLFVAYGYYQTIQAFRKFGRK